jgi:hypothetical protein
MFGKYSILWRFDLLRFLYRERGGEGREAEAELFKTKNHAVLGGYVLIGGNMDGIETRVFCPECKQELNFILEKVEVPMELLAMMRSLGIESPGHEIAFKGQKQCSCGVFVTATLH